MTAPDPRPGPPPPKAPAPPTAAPGTPGRAGTSQHDDLCICTHAGSRPVWCECTFIAEVRADERRRVLDQLDDLEPPPHWGDAPYPSGMRFALAAMRRTLGTPA